MKRFLIAVMLVLPAGALAGEAGETAAGQAIKSVFPDYVIMKEAELDSGMVEYLRQRGPSGRDRSLTAVTADFDGNGLEDHAAIVRTQDNSNGGFVVVLQTSEGRFRTVHNESFGTAPRYIFVSRVEAGQEVRQTEAIDAPMKAALLKHPAVELVFFEKAAVVYYWNPKTEKIETVTTGD